MKKYLVGIDGGGSNTKLILTDFDLNILEKSSGGASNFLKIGFEKAVQNVTDLVEPYFKKYDESSLALVIGTSGAGRESDANNFEKLLLECVPSINNIRVVSDAAITLKGAFENSDGAILIAGTGSILYYKIGNDVKRIGGYGRLIGDEGSGYSLGRRGINAISKMLDGRLEEQPLMKLAKTRLKINSTNELINKIYKDNFDIASFAEVVISSAGNGDQFSQSLIDAETDELIVHLKTMIIFNKLSKIDLVFSGGLVSSENLYRSVLCEKIATQVPQISIVEPKFSPEFGAVLIAKEYSIGKE